MQSRFGPYPAGFTRDILHSEPFPNFVSDLAKKAASALSARNLKRGEVFIKFGKRTYMESLLERGALRIHPASFFAMGNHNGAVRDDELTLSCSFVLDREHLLKVVVNPKDVPPDAPDQRIDINFSCETDYWLYCLTNSAEPRLFVDFEADSCVVVRDRGKFNDLLIAAVKEKLVGVTVAQGPALYIDPLLPKTAKVFVPLCKHFRYSYQDEYRFCWMPPTCRAKLEYLDIEVGNLKSMAELVVL